MALHSSPLRSATAAVAVAFIGAVLPHQADAADDPPGDGAITVVSHGDAAERVLLAAPVTQGSAADATTTIHMNMAMDASGLDFIIVSDSLLTQSIEVRSVDSRGYVAGETITSFAQSLTDADGERLDEDFVANFDGTLVSDFSPLVGVPLLVEYNNEQAIVDAAVDGVAATPEQHNLIASLIEGGPVSGTVPMTFPDMPLGEGAQWTVTAGNDAAGIPVPFAVTFALVSLKGGAYSIHMSLEADLADLFDVTGVDSEELDEVSGSITILGSLRGSVTNGLDRNVTAELLMNGTFVQDAVALDIDMTMAVEYTSAPRRPVPTEEGSS